MPLLGLIGYPLSHSFSRRYFRARFARTGLSGWDYRLFPVASAGLMPDLWQRHPELVGLNVTIPHKQAVIPLLDRLDETAAAVGAVNTIKREGDSLVGYNTDVLGFEASLRNLLGAPPRSVPDRNSPEGSGDKSEGYPEKALILGTGGAALAVQYVLRKMGIPFSTVSRSAAKGDLTYAEVTAAVLRAHRLIVNTTPLGMASFEHVAPELPYAALTQHHFLYDLIYNPAETVFLKQGNRAGATTANGLRMLELQAEAAWDIWTEGV